MPPEPDLSTNFELGPYLLAALICERVLEEKDGVLSAIRIVDRVVRSAYGPEPPAYMEPFEYDLSFLFVLKTGENPGNFRLTVEPIKPVTNERLPPIQSTLILEPPGDRGMNFVARAKVMLDLPGIWWFDVGLNGKRITRIPFNVIYVPQPTGHRP